jgi:hypothetical protein
VTGPRYALPRSPLKQAAQPRLYGFTWRRRGVRRLDSRLMEPSTITAEGTQGSALHLLTSTCMAWSAALSAAAAEGISYARPGDLCGEVVPVLWDHRDAEPVSCGKLLVGSQSLTSSAHTGPKVTPPGATIGAHQRRHCGASSARRSFFKFLLAKFSAERLV